MLTGVAICLRGLIIAMIAHVLLAVGKVIELAKPESPLDELVSLAGLLTVKVYRVMGKKGRKRLILVAGIMEVTAEPSERRK
jgi:hypothetical protein